MPKPGVEVQAKVDSRLQHISDPGTTDSTACTLSDLLISLQGTDWTPDWRMHPMAKQGREHKRKPPSSFRGKELGFSGVGIEDLDGRRGIWTFCKTTSRSLKLIGPVRAL